MRQESTESDTIDRLYSIECHKRALLRAHRDHSENMSEHNPDSILRVKRYFHHHQEQTHDVITTLFSVFTRTNVIWQNASFLSVAPLIPYSEKHCSFLEFSLPLVVTGGPLGENSSTLTDKQIFFLSNPSIWINCDCLRLAVIA